MEILYEDDDIIVVDKESGLPVQAGSSSQKDLISILKNHLHEESEKNSSSSGAAAESAVKGGTRKDSVEPYLGIIHRLDQPVEGIVVFAKNNKAAGNLSQQVQAKAAGGSSGKAGSRYSGSNAGGNKTGPGNGGQTSHSDMRKVYQAVVILKDKASYEKVKKAEHSVVVLQDYLKRNYQKNTTEIVREGTRDAKWAELTFRTLKIWPEPQNTLSRSTDPQDNLPRSTEPQDTLSRSTEPQDILSRSADPQDTLSRSADPHQGASAGGPYFGPNNTSPDKIYGKALLEIHLHTGRHHQIRVQLAGAGLPLDGDRKYGPAGLYYDYNLKLCASFLQFRHPATHRKMQFTVTPSFLQEPDGAKRD